ncbi:MAG: hypothetical protein OXK80_04360 [Bdellovibrionales bacterium]|nr:hypothetical protein [Bdellovibrionales bacterium]
MKRWNKTDRYIIIGSIGILLISTSITFDKVLRQELKKEQVKIAQQENHIAETLNIKLWRSYHEEQMLLMYEILKELKHQNNDPALTQQNQNVKANFNNSIE